MPLKMEGCAPPEGYAVVAPFVTQKWTKYKLFIVINIILNKDVFHVKYNIRSCNTTFYKDVINK